MDSTSLSLSIKNASGKTFSLLNSATDNSNNKVQVFKVNKMTSSMNTIASTPKRKYHCIEPGCNKSFTTSGHLARHNRIHTGEKNFHCLHPGCPSRFSRQDNMMQHYRTHLSQKLRKSGGDMNNDKPELYNHSYHSREKLSLFQPLVKRNRSITMPSLPYPNSNQNNIMNRPRRALSTSSSCSDSSLLLSPPLPLSQHAHHYYPRQHSHLHHVYQQQHRYYEQQPSQVIHHHKHESDNKQQQPASSLLHLANIVSTFG